MNKKVFAALSLLAVTGCGMMSHGSSQNIYISSNAVGVGIYNAAGERVCVTPCDAHVGRSSKALNFTAKKKGYLDRPFRLNANYEPNFFSNAVTSSTTFFPSIPFLTTDLTSGGAFEYEPGKVFVIMAQEGSPEALAEQREAAEVQRFILTNYGSLRKEAPEGTGEHITTLNKMTSTHDNEVSYIIEKTTDPEAAASQILHVFHRHKGMEQPTFDSENQED